MLDDVVMYSGKGKIIQRLEVLIRLSGWLNRNFFLLKRRVGSGSQMWKSNEWISKPKAFDTAVLLSCYHWQADGRRMLLLIVERNVQTVTNRHM